MHTLTSQQFSNGIPSKVKIGPVEYRVIMATEPKAPGKAEGEEVPVYGMVNFKKAEITIDNELNPMMAWQCFWHEVFHVIFEQLGLNNDDEGGTDALAYKLLEILVDNKFLRFPAMETRNSSSVDLVSGEVSIRGYSPYTISLAHGE